MIDNIVENLRKSVGKKRDQEIEDYQDRNERFNYSIRKTTSFLNVFSREEDKRMPKTRATKTKNQKSKPFEDR